MRFIPSLLIIAIVCIESSISSDYWALIAVGSHGWASYRHQADACHAYHVMLNKGVPAENIVVMMYDDIADNEKNETPGKIFNRPNGTNVYENVSIDYKGENVSAENFIQVLTGYQNSKNKTGTGRVIQSSEDSTIFINIIGHGGQGLVLFPEDELKASALQSALSKMSKEKRFGKIVFYVESSDAGSLFDGILPNNNSIIALTAAAQNEDSYAWYCIKYTKKSYLCLGDEFSITWMEHVDNTTGKYQLVYDHYEFVRHNVTQSHVSIYGDLRISTNVFKPSQKSVTYEETYEFTSVSNRDVSLFLAKHSDAESVYAELVQKRSIADEIMFNLTRISANDDVTLAYSVGELQYPLNSNLFDCYDDLVDQFREKCFKWTENPYFLKHLKLFVNICALGLNTTALTEGMQTVCSNANITGTVV